MTELILVTSRLILIRACNIGTTIRIAEHSAYINIYDFLANILLPNKIHVQQNKL